MRVLHLVKTSDGAGWAAAQAEYLRRSGVEVHVAVPSASGATIKAWRDAGAIIHVEDVSLPVSRPWTIPDACRRARSLVDKVAPAVIHSHFFSTTVLMRKALGSRHEVPLLFQVPGPLHLENHVFRQWDVRTARENDYWIGSSRCIVDQYRAAGISPNSVFLSYYGFRPERIPSVRTNILRRRLGIPDDKYMAGSICHIYAPKYYLGQRYGLKNHETMIEALALLTRQRSDTVAVLAGGPWAGAGRYFERLRRMADRIGAGRVLMPGALAAAEARQSWADYDCVLHIPASENCGGVVEPLAAHVPVVASRVGGLPEVVLDGITGRMVSARPGSAEAAGAVSKVLDDLPRHREMARAGATLVKEMFDVRRTADEIAAIYRRVSPSSSSVRPEYDYAH